jgi:hypothetical protein
MTLVESLRDVASLDGFVDIGGLADGVARARTDWEGDAETSLDRSAARAEMLFVARRLQGSGHSEAQHALVQALAEFAV